MKEDGTVETVQRIFQHYMEGKEREKSEYIVVQGTHDAIVSHELFDNVQQMIESNRRQSVDNLEVKSRPHQNVNLFTGVILCEDCNSGFHYLKNAKDIFVVAAV